MAEVSIYNPQVSVVIKKVVNRTSTAAQGVSTDPRVQNTEGKEIDLTPFLGRGSTVTVRRSVRGPDTGTFSVSIPDQMHPLLGDSIYGLVEAQDVIEIRMARLPTAGPLPLVLRGFVGEVSRNEMMGESGPVRNVVITGHDYMKLLHIMRMIYLPTMDLGELLLTAYSPFMVYGVDSSNFDTPAAFARRVVEQTINPFIAKMQAASGGNRSPVMTVTADASDSDIPAAVSPPGVQSANDGSIYDLLSRWLDVGAWNELYVEDREAGPALVLRPCPFKTAAGDYVQGGVAAAEATITAADVVSLNVARTDANVANYYWVDCDAMSLIQQPTLQLFQTAEPTPALEGYQNADKAIYGTRLMRQTTFEVVRYDGHAEASVKQGDGDAIKTINGKRRVLIESNKDNVVWEAGRAQLKGSETLKPGTYLTIDRGGFKPTFYVPEIEHSFTMGGAFITTATLERGDGYIKRLQRGFSSPAALAEMTNGGTYA